MRRFYYIEILIINRKKYGVKTELNYPQPSKGWKCH